MVEEVMKVSRYGIRVYCCLPSSAAEVMRDSQEVNMQHHYACLEECSTGQDLA
jgi:hypothetical protein